ncbi:MAG: hypothetical protein IKF14_15915 [Atopobiaceae bacterium]|nr:hypothetical protein [Atopobiaceae bacterium]
MGLTISHYSALEVTRQLRSKGIDLSASDTVPLRKPTSWVSQRLNMKAFNDPAWKWPKPSATKHLSILTPGHSSRMRVANIDAHPSFANLPARSILWLDERASMVCPELLFLQLAEVLGFPQLVLLGHELCGYFSRCAEEPLEGDVVDHVPPATTVESIRGYLARLTRIHGVVRAREALRYVSDGALSAPESVLATMYGLPASKGGYNMGPVTLNARIGMSDSEQARRSAKARYPDLLFPFAKIGLNYDGEGHLDLDGLLEAARALEHAGPQKRIEAEAELLSKKQAVREKVLDDNLRNMQLASRGYIVFPITKEDLYGDGNLDAVTRRLLGCAHEVFGIDVTPYEALLEDTDKTHDRNDLLQSLLPGGGSWGASYGKL